MLRRQKGTARVQLTRIGKARKGRAFGRPRAVRSDVRCRLLPAEHAAERVTAEPQYGENPSTTQACLRAIWLRRNAPSANIFKVEME